MRRVEGKCENCHKRPAECIWVGEYGPMAVSREYMQALWCNRCVNEARLVYAKARAAEIPELEAELAAVDEKRSVGGETA